MERSAQAQIIRELMDSINLSDSVDGGQFANISGDAADDVNEHKQLLALLHKEGDRMIANPVIDPRTGVADLEYIKGKQALSRIIWRLEELLKDHS